MTESSRQNSSQEAPPIGGWLVAIGALLCIKIFYMVNHLLNQLLPMFADGRWTQLQSSEIPAEQLLASQLMYEGIANLALLAAGIKMLMLFLTRSKHAPIWVTTWIVLCVLAGWYDEHLMNLVYEAASESPPKATGVSLLLVASLAYMKLSKRVKRTFIA